MSVPRVTSSPDHVAEESLSRFAVLLLAVVAALTAASLYYIQPLLDTVARQLSVTPARAALLVTGSQIGFVIGLAVVGPLGDRLDRRRLLVALLAASAAALALTAAMPGWLPLLLALTLVGMTAAAAQVAVPFAASLAAPSARGQVTGTVMSGLLIGILLARAASSWVAAATGWRSVFLIAAALMTLLAATATRALPADTAAKDRRRFGALFGSVFGVVRAYPALRTRMLLGAVLLAQFSALWTSLAFLLTSRYHLGQAAIGVFSLVGAAGATGAPFVGRLADRGHGSHATTGGWILVLLGWCLLWAGGESMLVLVIALLVVDFATQALQIANQARIYALPPEARGRITTAYMVTMFAGGVLGSALAGWSYDTWGWHGVCALGVLTGVTGSAIWATAKHR